MPLEIGTRLAHYDVTALIGEGGMGQVYQATDTKLNRQVALKILPEAFAADPDRLARFQREAQVLASLNHPNIAQIHGIEEEEGTRALVLELVEGPTLADRISKGPIPLDEALPIAKQIAEALEAAHEAGVIHRDLKPANIKVREDGTVKVLDFGLAKAFQPTTGSDPSESPTLTATATALGVVLGTAAYMSPEQARGKLVDKRADVWAFGAVLFEMLTGQKPFVGDDVSDTLALVLKFEPEWDALPAEAPARIRQLIRTCLQKDPKRRVHDVADVRLALEGAFEAAASVVSIPVPQLRTWRPIVAVALVGVGALAVGLAIGNVVHSPETERGVLRVVVTVGGDIVLASDPWQTGIAISPDGATLLYRAQGADGTTSLYRRPLAGANAEQLRGTENALAPFFSPNGESVGFITEVDPEIWTGC